MMWHGVVLAQDQADPDSAGSVETFTNSIGMKFARIPAGKFQMGFRDSNVQKSLLGSEAFFPWHIPVYEAVISHDIQMSCFEVTVEQYGQFVNDTGYKTENERSGESAFGVVRTNEGNLTWKNHGFDITPQHPVVNVSWKDAVAFCDWLSEKESVIYRLPSEVEWEYACRAGSEDAFSFGNDVSEFPKYGNIGDISLKKGRETSRFISSRSSEIDDGFAFTAPVGQFAPNAYGLYDMHGNVEEWCSDFFTMLGADGKPLPDADGKRDDNPDGDHIVRGGSWVSLPYMATSIFRRSGYQDGARNDTGFRVVRIEQDGKSNFDELKKD